MKTKILAASVAVAFAAAASAQTTQTTTHRGSHDTSASSHNPAIKDSDPARTTNAADGANSFTEDQARSRLTDAGYANVTKLAKDSTGVWRGTATKGGASVQVGLDYKGNVVTR
jgi:putative membrane protein